MGQENGKSLNSRIKNGSVTRTDVVRRLAELAFGRCNDCVKLIMEGQTPADKLDLSMLTEIKRNDKGTIEIKLVDRLQALEQLAVLVQDSGSDLESFLSALQGGNEP